jgi:hypothetical protein
MAMRWYWRAWRASKIRQSLWDFANNLEKAAARTGKVLVRAAHAQLNPVHGGW